jgi:transcriptional regulator with XRE-family HTH domain
MNFGEKIKQLRTDKNLTQPQLAEAIGIEQSYLSKLENDKSIPSADIFQAILKALSVDVTAFLDGIDDHIIHRQMRQIPDVANHLNAYAALKVHNIKKWLYCSALSCVLGLSLVAAGYKALVFSDMQYNYTSSGVLMADEPIDIFDRHDRLLVERMMAHEITSEEMHKMSAQFTASRVRPKMLLLNDYRGTGFTLADTAGERFYTLVISSVNERLENRLLMLLGVLLTLCGVAGFFVEYRLRSIKR